MLHVFRSCQSQSSDSLAQLETQATDQEMEQRELMTQNQVLQKQKVSFLMLFAFPLPRAVQEQELERKALKVKAADAELRRLSEDFETAKNELQPLKELLWREPRRD